MTKRIDVKRSKEISGNLPKSRYRYNRREQGVILSGIIDCYRQGSIFIYIIEYILSTLCIVFIGKSSKKMHHANKNLVISFDVSKVK